MTNLFKKILSLDNFFRENARKIKLSYNCREMNESSTYKYARVNKLNTEKNTVLPTLGNVLLT